MRKFENLKHIELSLINNAAYISTCSLTTIGLWMIIIPCIKVDWLKLNVEEKINLIKNALERSTINVIMPKNPKDHGQAVLKDFGFSSWQKFYEGGLHCSIDLDTGKKEYKITPMIYLKENNSLYGIKKGIEVLSSDASSKEIIETMEKVLGRIPQLTENYYANEDVSED